MKKVWIGDIQIPMNLGDAERSNEWHPNEEWALFSPPAEKKTHYHKDCKDLNPNDLCDAYRRPSGFVEATYCNENNLPGRGVVSIRKTESNELRVEEA